MVSCAQGKSKYVGVCLKKDGWYARVSRNRKSHFYGPFKTEVLAAKEYESVKARQLSKNMKIGVAKVSISVNKTIRKQFSQLDRNGIASKQEWSCNMCGEALGTFYEIDHLLPLQFGGSNGYRNLQAICLRCHRFKTQYLDINQIKNLAKEDGKVITRQDIEKIQADNLGKMTCTDPEEKVD